MIAELLAVLAIQTVQGPTISYTPPADLPDAVTRAVNACATIQMVLEANPERQIAAPPRSQTAANGAIVDYRIDRGVCQITASGWTPDGDAMARAVEAGLAPLPDAARRTRWREPFANERGPSVWTTFERSTADGGFGVFDLFEPADGAIGEVSITYQTVRR